ncbi:MAG: ATP-dependent zinc metalloprotease FtsH [Candidatus Cloacimonetes bacterium]|nr:ATP-dependent zinc metalloprotease FtsH [Candidatus Cloacimonadota bacterium]
MRRSQTITFWIVILLIIIVMYQMSRMGSGKLNQISYTEFEEMYKNREVVQVLINDKDLTVIAADGSKYSLYLPFEPDSEFARELTQLGINVRSEKPSKFLSILLSWLPFLIFIGFWFFMMRGIRGGANQAFSFGKSRARLSVSGKMNITFKDVAGVDEAKEELEEIIEFLKDPKKFQRLGGRIPRGVLLLGRPGTGKTLLAKAVAGEAKVPFYSISGSDFVEMFVGVGASRVRDMFLQAKKNAPCIAFIDEIDAVGRHRGTGLGGGHDEREQTLNQLLVEMDGFDPNDSVIIIAATNRPDVLDPALLRPGRFDRQVVVDLPDIKGREEIIKVHSRKLPIARDVSFLLIARGTPGFSGADLANLVNEAALLAARKNKKKIESDDFEEAKDKVTLGKARKSKVITEDDKRITAYHEVGHVLCSMFLEKAEPIHKVTIIPRGFTGGATHFLQTDKINYSRNYLLESLVGLLGGRAAEEVAFQEISTGAANDIQRVTDIAKKMVCNWGMSEKIGPMTVAKKESQVFLGRDFTQQESISEDTARLIDSEVRDIVNNAHDQAIKIIKSKVELLQEMSAQLLEKETLSADEIYNLAFRFVSADEKILLQKKLERIKEMRFESSSTNLPEKDEVNLNTLQNPDAEKNPSPDESREDLEKEPL